MINCVCSENTSRLDFVRDAGRARPVLATTWQVEQWCSTARRTPARSRAGCSSTSSASTSSSAATCRRSARRTTTRRAESRPASSRGERTPGPALLGEPELHAHREPRVRGSTSRPPATWRWSSASADGNYNANPAASADAVKDFSALGFRIGRAVYRGLLEGCRAIGNHGASASAPAGGFALHSTRQVVLRRCVAVGNRNASGTAEDDGLAAGFIASTPLADPQGGLVGGEDSAFVDCIADGNTVHARPCSCSRRPPRSTPVRRAAPAEGRGVPARAAERRARIIGCQSANNDGKGIWLRACRARWSRETRCRGTRSSASRTRIPQGSAPSPATGRTSTGPGTATTTSACRRAPVRKWTLGSPPLDGPSDGIANLSTPAALRVRERLAAARRSPATGERARGDPEPPLEEPCQVALVGEAERARELPIGRSPASSASRARSSRRRVT